MNAKAYEKNNLNIFQKYHNTGLHTYACTSKILSRSSIHLTQVRWRTPFLVLSSTPVF